MSELLNEIISFSLPEGIPSEESIRKLEGNQTEIDELFSAQKQIIFDFKKAVSSEFVQLEMELIKVKKQISEMKERENEKIEEETQIIPKKEKTKTQKSKKPSYVSKTRENELIRSRGKDDRYIHIIINSGSRKTKPRFVPSGRSMDSHLY